MSDKEKLEMLKHQLKLKSRYYLILAREVTDLEVQVQQLEDLVRNKN